MFNLTSSHRLAARAGRKMLVCAVLCLTACSGTPESREASHLSRGKRYLSARDFRKASIEFKVASQNMPKDAEPVYQLAMTYLKGGASRQALDALNRALALNPHHAEAQFQLALFRVGTNRPDLLQQARQTLTDRVRQKPADAETLGALALAEAKLGHHEEAQRRLLAFVDEKPANLRPAEFTIAVYMADADVAAAKSLAKAIAEHAPNSPDAALLQAQVSLASHDPAAADAEVSRALALKPDFRPALFYRMRRQLSNSDQAGAEQTAQIISRLPDKQSWPEYARLLFIDKKVDPAKAEYERVLRDHGDPADLRAELALLLRAAGRSQAADAVIAQTLKKYPKVAGALLQKATLEIDRGDLDAAAADVETLRSMKVASAQFSFEQSRIMAARGEKVREGDLLTEALQRSPRFLRARVALAQLLCASGRGRSALAILDQADAAEKAMPVYIYTRNAALVSAGEWDEARKGVDTGLSKDALLPGFHYQDAALRSRHSDLAGARKSIEAGLSLAPADPLGWTLLGDTMQRQGESALFSNKLKDAAAKNPSSAPLQKMWAEQLLRAGDPSAARAALDASSAAGGRAAADPEIAILEMRSGALDTAKERLLELVKTHDSAKSRLLLAEIELRQGSTPGAIREYMKALAIEPSNPVVMNNLAGILADRRQYDDALFWAQKALVLAPGSPMILDTVGWTYYRQGKYEAALPFLYKSLHGQNRPIAHYHLAAELLRAGDPARARVEFEAALKQDPASPSRAEVAALFDARASR